MKMRIRLTLLRGLYYGFILLTLLSGLAFIIMMAGKIGLSNQPVVRGWVRIMEPSATPRTPGTNGAELLNFNRQEAFFVHQFPDLATFFQGGYLDYTFLEILGWLLAISIVYQLTRLFRNLDAGKVFHVENVWRMRAIAGAMAAWPLVKYVGESVLFRKVVRSNAFADLRIAPNHQVEAGVLMIVVALIILALVEIFHTGVRLQQEQDLTV